ncbi:MAG: helix-turn-helix domain-containing protein [Cellulosilyticaceae bacterium]
MTDYMTSLFTDATLIDLRLYEAGWQKCKPLHALGSYIRSNYIFHYILSGQGTFSYYDSHGTEHTHQLLPHQGFLIAPDQIISYAADADHPWEYTWIEFNGLRAKDILAQAGLSRDYPIFNNLSIEKGMAIKDKMRYLSHHPHLSSTCALGHLYLILDTLTDASTSRCPLAHTKRSDHYISQALSYIQQHYQEPLSIEALATYCNLNRSYFGKLFKEKCHVSPQQFLLQYRMEKAAQLLLQTALPIHLVGQAVGYSNQLHFSKAFKSIYHQSPSHYRQTV